MNNAQGFAVPNEVFDRSLRSGFVSPNQATPLWGGMGVTPSMPPAGLPMSLGAMLSLATDLSSLRGLTTFSGSEAMIEDDPSTVPLAAPGDGTNPGGAINWFALGSGAYLWLQCSPNTATAIRAAKSISQPLFWDYVNQVLLTTPASPGDLPIDGEVLQLNIQAQVVAPAGAGWISGCAALIEI